MSVTRTLVITRPGGPEVLALVERPVPAPARAEVLVDVAAVGLNRADLLQRAGHYPAPPGVVADVPGLEFSGTVAALGAEAGRWRVGERVMGLVPGGACAERLVVPQDELLAVPERLSLEQAAAIPEAFVTAWDALCVQGNLARGELVLLHAVGSGVGTAALQLAREAGAIVAGSSRSADKLRRAAALGLQHGLLVERVDRQRPARFAEALRAATGGRGADLILDTVGAAYLQENLAALAERGRLVVIGLLGGARAELPLGTLLARRARLIGTVLRSRGAEERARLAADFARQVLPRLADGALFPVVDAVLPMEDAAAAHARLAADASFGKLVLRW